MFESINEHNKLVDKLVAKIKTDYNTAKHSFLISLRGIELFDDDKSCDFISIHSTVLSWIKHNIIDNNGQMFRIYSEANIQNDTAIYYVNQDDIEVLLYEIENFIAHLEFYLMNNGNYKFNYNNIGSIFCIEERNLHQIISPLERVIWHKSEKYKELHSEPV